MRFQFGDSNDTSVCIDAENLEQAIKIFKVSELFPEKYVSNKFWKKDKGGYYDREYDNDLHRYTVNFKPNPKIFIYDDDRKKVGQVDLEDCLSIDFRSILPAPAGLLEAPAVSDDTPTEEVPSNLPVIGSEQAVRAINQKQVLREHHDALMRKKAELENLMRDVNKSLDVLHKELKHGTDVLKILFLPKDDRWDPKIQDYKPRTRSIPFRLYKDEVLNFDEVSLEDAKYYETNRLYRREYLDILPALHYVKIVRKGEVKLEEEFVKYIAGQLKWEESRYSEIRKAVAWWKLKNKWKRALMADEAKAVRMIIRKLMYPIFNIAPP